MYLEHLKILIGRAGWKVTKLYAHYTFEQERFSKYINAYIKFVYRRKQSYSFTNIANIVRLIKKSYLDKSKRSK